MIRGRNRILGPDHEDTLLSKHNCAIILDKLQRFGEAKKMEEEVLRGRVQVLGPSHRDTLQSKFNYGITLKNLQQYDEAKKQLRTVVILS